MQNTLPVSRTLKSRSTINIDFKDMTGGLNTRVSPLDIQPNEVSDCSNVLFQKYPNKVTKRGGNTLIHDAGYSSAIVSTYVFLMASGIKYYIRQIADDVTGTPHHSLVQSSTDIVT